MKRNLILLGFCLLIALAAIIYGRFQRSTPLNSIVVDSTFTALPIKTLIPTYPSTQASPTPAATVYLINTRAGQTLYFNRLKLEPNDYVAYHTEAVPQGIPLKNGVEVSFDYILRVDFGAPSPDWDASSAAANWPVTIILTDGSKIESSLGFKAQHLIHVTGQSSMGTVDLQLVDINSLVIKRTTPTIAIPQAPQGMQLFNVKTAVDEPVAVADIKVFARCMYEVYCCHDESLTSLPVTGGADIILNSVQSVSFAGGDKVEVSLVDQPAGTYTLRPSKACPESEWRLRGKAALGDFELPLAAVQQITR